MFFRQDQAGPAQDRHVVRNGGLGEPHVVLDVTRAHANSFADGTFAFLLQQAQDLEPRRIGYSLERDDELLVRHSVFLKIDLDRRINLPRRAGGSGHREFGELPKSPELPKIAGSENAKRQTISLTNAGARDRPATDSWLIVLEISLFSF